MLRLYPKFKTSFALSQNYQQEGPRAPTGRLDKFKTSLKDFFARERKMDASAVDALTASLPALNTSLSQPHVTKIVIMDDAVLQAFHDLYKALHDPSILDARRHHRYNLYPPVIAETPITDSADIVRPRCRRSLVIYEITTSDILSTSDISAATGSCVESPAILVPLTDAPRAMSTLDLQVIRFLGEGTSGKVYFVKDRISKAKVALKVVPKTGKNEYALSVIVQERDIAEKLSDSPWFVNLWAAWHDQANMYIAMTAYPTDLDSEMLRCGTIEPARARFYMAEIIIALTELHSRGIIHRDIKAANILIDRQGHIVLADFGLSKDFGEIPTIAERVYQPYWPYLRDENPTSETEPRNPEELSFVAWDYRGSELEMAPEIHLRQAYSFGVDFWSSAVVLYWMLTGRPPFYEDEDEYEDEGEEDVKPLAYKIAEDPLYWDLTDNVDDETKGFLEKMLEKDPKERLMISYEMLNHPYFNAVNWTLMEERMVPPPWIPEREVCHVYEPTSPIFTPGEPFTDDDPDPCPEFNFMSQQAADGIAAEDAYESDEGSDDGSDTVTDDSVAEIMRIGSYEDFSFTNSPSDMRNTWDQANDNGDALTLRSDSINEDTPLKETWNFAIVNRPPTKPCGPGPKRWLHVQDLVKLRPVISNIDASEPVNPGDPEEPCSTPPTPAFEITQTVESYACNPPPQVESDAPYTLIRQQSTHIVNGTGVLFKVKVWMSKLWTPKPKKALQLKRLSLLA